MLETDELALGNHAAELQETVLRVPVALVVGDVGKHAFQER